MAGSPAGTPHKLLYGLVARGAVVLAEHSTVSGNANMIAVRILEKLGPDDTRVSFSQDRHMFHVLVQNGLTFMCMAEESAGRRIPFMFLDDLRNRFVAMYGVSAKDAVAYEYNTEFGPVLAERMTFHSSPQADTLTRVQGELTEVKGIMVENIEKVLERGEKLDLLVGKTDALSDTALHFRREARRLRTTLWWRNAKMWVAVGGSLLILLYFILAMVCGPTLRSC